MYSPQRDVYSKNGKVNRKAGKCIMKRTIITIGMLAALLFNILSISVYADETGMVSVQGLRLQYADDGSLQAFADVSLSDIQATGVDFELKYDNRYLTPSEFATNTPTREAALMMSENTAPFEAVLEKSKADHVFELKLSQILSNLVEVNLVPNPNLTKLGYITKVDAFAPEYKKLTALNIPDSNIQVVTMSFKVTDTETFLKLSGEELSNLLRVESDAHYVYVNSDKLEYFDDTPLNVQVSIDTEHIPAKPTPPPEPEEPTEQFNLTGVVAGWNPNQPFIMDIYSEQDGSEALVKTVKSTDADEEGNMLYGITSHTMLGYTEWAFSIPLDRGKEYTIRLSKLSHIDYIDVSFTAPETENELNFNTAAKGEGKEKQAIELIAGDINDDGLVTFSDRAEFMRFFNLQKPKELFGVEFNKNDLNGDGTVSFSDYDLLLQNYDKQY